MPKTYIDLSHSIIDGEITYKGLPAPIVCDYLSRETSQSFYEEGTSFQIGKIEMVGNSGTYLDCPFHRYESGKELTDLMLHQLADLEGVLITVPFEETLEIEKMHFEGYELHNKAVLIHTDWSRHWQTDTYFEKHPYLSAEAAHYLEDNQVALVGIDSYNVDDTSKNSRPVHSILLKNDILIIEHMTNLNQLVGLAFTFTAVPPKIEKIGSFPVRAFATIKASKYEN